MMMISVNTTARVLLGLAFLAATPPLIASCIVSDSMCSENQVEVKATNSDDSGLEMHVCRCAPGYVLSARGYGCDPCGEHETVAADKCVCETGYVKLTTDGPCEESSGSPLGSSCSATMPCADPNPFCALSESEPFCTTEGCSVNDDCPADWRCAKDGQASHCTKPPKGLYMSCASPADCAPTEAKFCETFRTNTCIVNGCAANPSSCQSGTKCCDLSGLIGTSLCVAAAGLTDGNCADGKPPL